MEDEIRYLIALTRINGIGPKTGRLLVSYCGSAEGIFSESKKNLGLIPGIGSAFANKIVRFTGFDQIEGMLLHSSEKNIRPLPYTSSEYPYRLKQIPDCPLLLYVKGKGNLNPNRIIAMIGTRKPTNYGKRMTENILRDLRDQDCTVISGMAYGIDILSHRLCEEYKIPSFGVMAHGLDIVYPGAHSSTAHKLLETGGLISEFEIGTGPDAINFPRRNRIVAGMVDGVVVIESATEGGSMITADYASQYDREIMAVPGNPLNRNSSGCNLLIKGNKATLIESAADVIKVLNWDIQKKGDQVRLKLAEDLSKDEKVVLEALKNGPLFYDDIPSATQIPSEVVGHILLELEIRDFIEKVPGNIYQAI